MTSPREQPVVIQGSLSTPMLGVLTSPGENVTPSGLGVVIVNGGAQYRAGAHRMHVQLARHLANAGHTALRFDFPGQGDSPGDPVSFEATAPHIGAAIDALQRQTPPLQRLALFGLCDGASASLLYLHARPDPRITHLVLLNPWTHDEVTSAQTHLQHYYSRRLLMPDFWRKLLRGDVGVHALKELAQKLRLVAARAPHAAQPDFRSRMMDALKSSHGQVCLILSGADHTAGEFRTFANRSWRQWHQSPRIALIELPGADHTCSTVASKEATLSAVGAAFKHGPAQECRAP